MSNYEDNDEQHLYLPGEVPGLLSFPASVQDKLDRARALMDQGSLGAWLEAGLKRTISGGSFTAIFRADRLNEALAAPQKKTFVPPDFSHS